MRQTLDGSEGKPVETGGKSFGVKQVLTEDSCYTDVFSILVTLQHL